MRRLLAAVVPLVLVAACGDPVEVGFEEAIEILILDGLDRQEAECIVGRADGVIDLARVTGVEPEITEEELATLATISSSCRSVVVDDATIAGGQEGPTGSFGLVEGATVEQTIEQYVQSLVTGGLDPAVGPCVETALLGARDPIDAMRDPTFVAEALRLCDR